jgi:ABC-type uncharacterized transport system substrate-binding protein
MHRRSFLGACFASALAMGPARVLAQDAAGPRPKILYVMSYHSPWRWTDGQLQGFREALGVPADFRVFQMDTKKNSTPEAMAAKGREAMALVESWRPDLVYTSDDDAQEHFARHYAGKALPFVFSGVNRDPKVYGFEGSPNVTGVLEREHFVESVRLLQSIVPGAKRLAVVLDDSPMWGPVVERMRASLPSLAGTEVVAWDTIRTFDEYKAKVAAYPERADAIALIGIFNFRGAGGRNVPYQEVLRWTAEHSTLPDLGFWIDRVHFGTLCAVTVSEREQGLAAGRMARAILVDGASASALPMRPTTKGLPVISLARARQLRIPVKSGLLLSAEVVESYQWQRP